MKNNLSRDYPRVSISYFTSKDGIEKVQTMSLTNFPEVIRKKNRGIRDNSTGRVAASGSRDKEARRDRDRKERVKDKRQRERDRSVSEKDRPISLNKDNTADDGDKDKRKKDNKPGLTISLEPLIGSPRSSPQPKEGQVSSSPQGSAPLILRNRDSPRTGSQLQVPSDGQSQSTTDPPTSPNHSQMLPLPGVGSSSSLNSPHAASISTSR